MKLSGEDWVELNRLLDEALDLEPERRAQWLDSLPSDSGLSQTLRQLLARDGAPETAEVLLDPPSLEQGKFASVASGDIVGPYRVIRELGSGGTATVWLAERTDGSLRRQVALKLPRVAWMDRGLAERLNRERDILSSLEHPSIARLYDAGVDEAGRPFLALEYVEGVPLDQYAFDRGLPVAQRLSLFVQVARAVAFAHAHLIVHRDLKPSNILVKDDGEVRLLDFGIARLLQPESLHDLQLTRVGSRALTPQYAAPEQFTSQPITVATDVYSLGVLLYSLLTARSPYDLKRDSLVDLEDAIVNRDPVPMIKGMEAKLARTLRGDLEMIVGKAMSKQPAHRYETVNAFIDDIERYQNQLPVRARPPQLSYRVKKFIKRNTASVVAGGVTASALTLGLSIALWQTHVARGEAQRAERIKSFIASIFTQAVPKQGVGGVVTASDLLTAANKRVESELGASRRDKSELQTMIGASFLALDEPGNATQVLQQALENCDAEGDTAETCKLNAAVLLSDSLQRTRGTERALAVLNKYLPSESPAQPAQVAIVVAGHRLRGVLLCELTFHDEGLASLLKAKALAERMLGPNHLETLGVLAAIAESHRLMQRDDLLPAAEEAMRRATASRAHLRPDVMLAQIERIYATALYASGRGGEAEPILRRVLADQRLLDPSDTSRIADGEWVLADVLNSQGRLDEVIPLLRHSIDVDRNYLTNSADVRRRLLVLGATYAGVRMPEETLQVTARWDAAAQAAGAQNAVHAQRNVLIRAHAMVHSGRWQEAARLTESVRRQTEDAAQRIESLVIDATSARLQDQPARAGQLAREIVAASDKIELAPSKRATYLSEAAASFLAVKQFPQARAALDQARLAYANAGITMSVRMSDYIVTDAQLRMISSEPVVDNELRALADVWQRANPDSIWHAEALYWLARVQQFNGIAEARDNQANAVRILRQSTVPALRGLAEA